MTSIALTWLRQDPQQTPDFFAKLQRLVWNIYEVIREQLLEGHVVALHTGPVLPENIIGVFVTSVNEPRLLLEWPANDVAAKTWLRQLRGDLGRILYVQNNDGEGSTLCLNVDLLLLDQMVSGATSVEANLCRILSIEPGTTEHEWVS